MFNTDVMFAPETYAPVGVSSSHRHSDMSSSLYTWELVFWGYVLMTHWTLVSVLTSPSDAFDTVIAVVFTVACLMFLCRPRGDGGDSGAGSISKGMALSTLLVATWLTFSSIPHAYEVRN